MKQASEIPSGRQLILPIFLGLLALIIAATPAADATAAPVIENIVLDSTLRLEGPRWNGTIVRNVTIRGVDGDGIFLRNVESVRIENCSISDVTGRGIQLSIEGSTRDVRIVGNRISNTGLDGISAGQRHARGVDHPGLVVRDNRIERTGLKSRGGRNHGIYVQSTDFLIEGNLVRNSADGNGISVRSSGTVRNNVVQGSGKSGIAYYPDHMAGPSNTLVIEGNRVSDSGRWLRRADIDLLRIRKSAMAVRAFIIRDNRVDASIRVHADYATLGIMPRLSGNEYLACSGGRPCSTATAGD